MAGTISERMALDYARRQLKEDEGYSTALYKDSLGNLTGGFGHCFIEGSTLPDYVWDIIFNHDFRIALLHASQLLEEYNVPKMNNPREIVLYNMSYNLGYNKLKKFREMFKALQRKDYEDAADCMLDSLWAKQVKSRADRLAKMMRTGRYI